MQVSPESWKGASAHTMKLSQAIIARSDRGLRDSRSTDPLPLLRDACIRESNNRIHAYVRTTRAVIVHLRKKLVATNEEIKALTRGKESLERALEHTRKDLALNHQSIEIRGVRPVREKEPDAADLCLLEERTHLLSIKCSLEAQLSMVQQQLQVLSVARSRLAAIVQERSRVTDLLCHSMTSTVPAASQFSSSSQIFNRGNKVLGGQRKQRSQSAQGSYMVQRSKSHSAPVPLQLSVIREETGSEGEGVTQTDRQEPQNGTDPYDAFSPESQESVRLATEAISKSQEIRRVLRSVIDTKRLSQATAHSTVNEGLTRKLAETITLTQHLQVNAGQVNLAMHRDQRCLESQEKGHGYLLGPVSASYLMTRERLDRPLVRVFQRHPGTELPEASHFAQANAAYNESLETTRKNLMLLKLAQKGLQADIRDKKIGADIDSNIVRLRRQRANHRWVLNGNMTSSRPHPKLVLRDSTVASPSPGSGASVKSGSRERVQNGSTASGYPSSKTTSTRSNNHL